MTATQTSSLALSKEQKTAYNQLSEVAKPLAKQIRYLADNIATVSLIHRHQVGKIVDTLLLEPSKFGDAVIHKIASYLGGAWSSDELYQCRSFAVTYTVAEIERLLKRPMLGGGRITWTHLSGLCRLTNDVVRKDIQEQIFVRGTSAKEFRRELQEKLGRKGKGGRRPIPPKSIAAGLSQMNRFAGEAKMRESGWSKSIFSAVKTAGPDQITPELRTALQDSRNLQTQLQADVAILIEQLDIAIERADTVLSKKIAPPVEKAGNGSAKKKKSKSANTVDATAAHTTNGSAKKKKLVKPAAVEDRIAKARRRERQPVTA